MTRILQLCAIFLCSLAFLEMVPASSFAAGNVGSAAANKVGIQVFEGKIAPSQLIAYQLTGLKKGDKLKAHLHSTSGNLDPIVALLDIPFNYQKFKRALREQTEKNVAAGQDPRDTLTTLAKGLFLAWNADPSSSYDADFETVAPHDGSFLILVAGALVLTNSGTNTEATFGDFRLVLGLNTPMALNQDTPASGGVFAMVDPDVGTTESRVQYLSGELNATRPQAAFVLNTIEAGSTLTVLIEGDAGKAPPDVQLLDFGKRTLRRATVSGQGMVLSYTFAQSAQEHRLRLTANPDSYGSYKVTLGIDAPDILTGKPTERGGPVARPPIPVTVSFKLDQIFNIVQKEEKFSVAATLRLQWQDSGYAFSPASCNCNFKTFNEADFRHFVDERHLRWPEFIIYNIQGSRSSQRSTVSIESDGTAYYMERFSADLQAPAMNFRQFPFDTQDFYIHIDSIFPSERYRFSVNQQKTGIGNQVGAEEWKVLGYDTPVTLTSDLRSRFTFHVAMKREIIYYLFKIFLPLIIIMIVSWMTFLLDDYNKRADITGGHLLLFIAFSFTLSNDLPRLGYLTFIDVILANAFLVGGLVVALNLWMKKMESSGHLKHHVLIDRLMLILYPVAYFVPWLVALLAYQVI